MFHSVSARSSSEQSKCRLRVEEQVQQKNDNHKGRRFDEMTSLMETEKVPQETQELVAALLDQSIYREASHDE